MATNNRLLEIVRVSLIVTFLLIVFHPQKGFTERRAVSLKVLQQKVESCMAYQDCSKNIIELCGLKKIDGFVIDKKNGDIILIGKVDFTSPPLYLEDFVISLRNAQGKYSPYSPPGCSIDPTPETLKQLQWIRKKIANYSTRETERFLEQWHTICIQPEQVRVIGIPFDTHFAKVMVKADYYMKRVVDNSALLGIEGFEDLSDMTLNKVKRDCIRGQSVSLSPSLNRFWFFPGNVLYVKNKGIVIIKQCQIRLLTEEEFLAKTGEVTSTGYPDPLAKRFAENFTAKYEQIAEKKPIYAELESLFRFIALVRAINHENAISKAGINLHYLLDQYPITETYVDRTLPGISHVKSCEISHDSHGSCSIGKLWLPSCGGVSMDIKTTEDNFVQDKTGEILEIKKTIIKGKPSPDALYWDF